MPRSPFIALALAVAAAATAGVAASGTRPAATPAAARGPEPLLAVLPYHVPLQLSRLDPKTLRARPGARVDVGYPGCAPRHGGEACWGIPPWSLAHGRLAVARNSPHEARSVRIVDPRGVRADADIPLYGGPIGLVSWVDRDHLIALQEVCCNGLEQVLTLDVPHRGILAAVPVGSVLRVARTPHALVMLAARPNAIGTAQLEIAGGDGIVRELTLDRIWAGIRLVDPVAQRVQQRVPELAVDPAGRRAFVVAPGLVAEVRLDDLAVSYHAPARSTSLLQRLHEWIEPAALAKSANGPVLSATWLGDGRLAVGGDGVRLLDTRTWRVRTLDPKASDVRAQDGVLLTSGPDGVAAYDADGRQRFHLLAGKTAWVEQVYAGRAYVRVAGVDDLEVVDLAGGRTVGTRPELPWLLTGRGGSWWD